MGETLSAMERKARIRRGDTLETLGLTFYPIKMAQYEEFLEVRDVLTLRISSLPAKYITFPLLGALWAYEVDTIQSTHKALGLFDRAMRFLYMALRLTYNRDEVLKTIYCQKGDLRILTAISVPKDDGTSVKITPRDFDIYVRKILCDQNGLAIPDESFNPELVQAEQALQAKQQSQVNFNIDDLMASVSYASRLTQREIDELTVLQFDKLRAAIDRDKNYMLYNAAALSGMVKFPKGNPYPSWCFDKKTDDGSGILKSVGEVKGNFAALGDLENVVQKAQKS